MGIPSALFRFHRRVISTDQEGIVPFVARELLCLPAMLYWLAIRARNGLYDLRIRRSHPAPAPVISIGNITAGGTGKTPMAAWLARLLQIHNMRPAILSRGYGRRGHDGPDDENEMLARLAAGTPVIVDPDRLRAARSAVQVHGADVVILDDGFQHQRIARDLDIVLVDALCPFGAGWVLPRGLLREPLSALARADFLIVTRADLVGVEELRRIKQRLARLVPAAPIACCVTIVRGLRPLGPDSRESVPPATVTKGRWAAFCGIGNPDAFLQTLRRVNCSPAPFTVFADHERYKAAQVEALLAGACGAGCDGILTTEKDAVKVQRLLEHPPALPVFAVQTEMDLVEGSGALTAAILRATRDAH
jgi:tetraacyldisaccharide 4'-kinase